MIKVLFAIQSTTIKFQGYNLKNAPVSTGRADLLARFIISSLFKPDETQTSVSFNDTFGVWIFLNDQFIGELSAHLRNLGKITANIEPFSVLITSNSPFFKLSLLNKKKFYTEFDILQALYESFENLMDPDYQKSIFAKYCGISLLNSMEEMHSRGYKIIILDEKAPNFLKVQDQQAIFEYDDKLLFIIGDQLGYLDFESKDLDNLPDYVIRFKLGNESQLSSSMVTLVKFKLNESQIK